MTAITGQNGAGKTTLAQILCGLAKADKGTYPDRWEKSKSGSPAQGDLLLRQRHVNAVFYGKRGGGAAAEYRLTEESKDRARHLLKEFGLYEYRDAHPSTLSGGQKQRLAIACAIFSGRRILILDEPTSGLDGQNMRLIAERLKSEARNGRTILVITHDRELIESCCDNIVEVEKRSS
ncbi:MAG: ATP-binding cassette domain-containing protein [Blautia massiliensis (ex Durand et al. 2017)]